MADYLPTPSCLRSFWMTPRSKFLIFSFFLDFFSSFRQVVVTFVIKKEQSFAYQVGQMKHWVVMYHLVISMEIPVFTETALSPKDAPVILAGNYLHK